MLFWLYGSQNAPDATILQVDFKNFPGVKPPDPLIGLRAFGARPRAPSAHSILRKKHFA